MDKLPEIRRIFTWTDSDAEDILRRANAAVQASGVPPYLQEIAFDKAVTLLSHHVPVAVESGIAVPDGLVR